MQEGRQQEKLSQVVLFGVALRFVCVISKRAGKIVTVHRDAVSPALPA